MRLSSSLTSASHSACGPFQSSFIGKFEHILGPCVYSLFTVSLCRSMTAKNKKNTAFLFSFYIFLPFVSPFLFHFRFSQTGIGQGTSNLFMRQAEPQWVLAGLKGFLPSLQLFQHPLPFGWGRKDVSSRAEAYSFVGWRTAGVLETNQVDSILRALAAFLTNEQGTVKSAHIFILITLDYLVFPHRTYVHHFNLR